MHPVSGNMLVVYCIAMFFGNVDFCNKSEHILITCTKKAEFVHEKKDKLLFDYFYNEGEVFSILRNTTSKYLNEL